MQGRRCIFPAMPSSWKDVEFHNLRAEGAFLVCAKRAKGRTAWVRIKSLAGEPCRVKPGFHGEVRVQSDRPLDFMETSPGVYEIDLRKGEEMTLHTPG